MALAFPGAEGYGANTVGGRGGEVIEVTNLNNSGPGSLRAAIEATGPRIVVFRVGGTIELLTDIRIKNPYITIAGQTAPGDGITLKNDPSNPDSPLVVETGEVIIRYVRFRPGASTELSDNLRALTIGGDGKNIIIDHCSFSWATDENLTVWDNASDISIQWSIVSEGLYNSTSSSGTQSQAVYFGSQSTRISLHHNLLAHNNRRNPRVMGGDIDIVNNVIYNTEGTPTRLWSDSVEHHVNGGRYNYVGNYIKSGSNSSWTYEVKLRSRDGNITIPATFISSNIGPNRPDESVPDEAIVHPDGREFMIDTRHDFPLVTTTPAFEAYDQVLAGAGVTLPGRDVVDERIIDEVINGTGQIIDDPSEVGGWPSLAAGVPPDDSDHDGMPDQWEKLYGFNPNDATDGPADADADGYTNVEEYLNGTHPRIISADIALAKESDSDTVVVGNEFSYILNVYNNGPDIATNVTLTDTLAENLSFVSVTTSQGNCSGKNIVSCDLDAINVGDSATVTITVIANSVGSIKNFASVFATEIDSNQVNNIDSIESIVEMPTSVDNAESIISKYFELKQNFPNPFNPTTTIEYSIPSTTHVELRVYNLRGEEVASLVKSEHFPGNYKIEWDGTGLASGVYFYRLVAEEFVHSKKLLLLK